MRRTLILLPFLIACFNSHAQTADEKLNLKIDSLKGAGIDTLMIYFVDCVGYVTLHSDSCTITDSKYLWWKQNNKTLVQLFDNCYSYKEFMFDTLKSFDFYLKNKMQIDPEQIKRPEYKRVTKYKKNGKSFIKEEVRYSTVDHSCHDMFKFICGSATINKDCDKYDIAFKRFDDGQPNTNWEYNQKTKLKMLIDIINKETNALEKIFEKLKE